MRYHFGKNNNKKKPAETEGTELPFGRPGGDLSWPLCLAGISITGNETLSSSNLAASGGRDLWGPNAG